MALFPSFSNEISHCYGNRKRYSTTSKVHKFMYVCDCVHPHIIHTHTQVYNWPNIVCTSVKGMLIDWNIMYDNKMNIIIIMSPFLSSVHTRRFFKGCLSLYLKALPWISLWHWALFDALARYIFFSGEGYNCVFTALFWSWPDECFLTPPSEIGWCMHGARTSFIIFPS